jgi:hypothetical protein
MDPLLITLLVFLCAFGGILLGTYMREQLPDHHLGDDSKDIVKLSTGLIATLTALTLGLLVASANDSFQSFNDGLDKMGADFLTMDRAMAAYGPETHEAREALRQYALIVLLVNWPEDKDKLEGLVTPAEMAASASILQAPSAFSQQRLAGLKGALALSNIQDKLLKLAPKDDAQRWRQARALEISGKMVEQRWLLIEQTQAAALPTPFLVMLVIWLVILFITFSLFAPSNKTVKTVLILCAMSVSGAIFLMLELGKPTGGLLKASSAPIIKVLDLLGQ